MKNVLIISSSEGVTLTMLRNLGSQGYRPHVFSVWPSTRYTRLSRHCAGYTSHHVRDLEEATIAEFAGAVSAYCTANNIEMIIPTGWWSTYVMAGCKEAFTSVPVFPLSTRERIHELHDKWSMYELLSKLGVAAPKSALINREKGIGHLGLEYPLIAKPTTSGNSAGVCKIDTPMELNRYLANAAPDETIMVQEFIEGHDGVLGFFARDGELLAWSIHAKKQAGLEFFNDEHLIEGIRAILRHTGFNGAGNFDLRINEIDGSCSVLECNPRFWGSFGISKWYGVDVVGLGIQVALGEEIPQSMLGQSGRAVTLPYPAPKRFVKSLLSRSVSENVALFSDLPWQMLSDPLPALYAKLQQEVEQKVADDTKVVEQEHVKRSLPKASGHDASLGYSGRLLAA